MIDVSVPSAPVEVGFVDTPHYANGVAVNGSYAFVADGSAGLRVISIANPSAPSEVGSVDTPGSANDVAVAGSYAYIADGSSGLRVISIANPSAPVEVGAVDTPDFAYGVAVAGSYAYVADFNFGLRVISIANPAMPSEVGFVGTQDTPTMSPSRAVWRSLPAVSAASGWSMSALRARRVKSVFWTPEGRPGGSRRRPDSSSWPTTTAAW